MRINIVIYDKIVGKLTDESYIDRFKIMHGKVSNILTIVLPLMFLDRIMNVMGNRQFLINSSYRKLKFPVKLCDFFLQMTKLYFPS